MSKVKVKGGLVQLQKKKVSEVKALGGGSLAKPSHFHQR